MGPTLNGYGVMGVCNCRKRRTVNHAPQVTQRDLEGPGTGIVSRSCNWQLALFTTERQSKLRPAVVFSKTCLIHNSE
jgi:hypothetical protein